MKNGFRNAKVGDRVWDIMHGWGKIIEIRKDLGTHPIKVSDFEKESLRTKTYTWEGKAFKNHINPTLFWDKINIKPPSKPEVQSSDLMDLQYVINAWNAQADKYNQWYDLGCDEKREFTVRQMKEGQMMKEQKRGDEKNE